MLCLNSTSCLTKYRCVLGNCVYLNEYYLDKQDGIDYNNALTLPMVGAILHDLPSLRNIYFGFFLGLILIGLINNIFSLITFIRDRIRYTICGIYLIIYSICSLILMILILTNLISVIYYDNYLFRLWACHGYPYLSLILVYTSILISALVAIEGVLTTCFDCDKFRPRKPAIMISISIVIIVSISNLDKMLTRRLIMNQSGHFACQFEKSFYEFSANILFYIYIIIPCLIHLICLISIFLIPMKKSFVQKIFYYQNNVIPSLFIILCLFLNGLYRYLFHSYFLTNLSKNKIRLHVGYIFLVYAPQIFTYMIYVLPNEFYVKEFYQIWFYRKLCCCFYDKRRHVQEFKVIHKLWQRRTSLETVKTISNLDDTYVDSEFYKKDET